jgi:hypothetical protein
MTTLKATNDPEYRAMQRMLKAQEVQCWRGCGRLATSPDHHPPPAPHTHIRSSGCCTLHPSCLKCQKQQGAAITNQRRSSGYTW